MKPNIILLGGIFPNDELEDILKNSRGPVQNAADALQKKIIYGLDMQLDNGLTVINLPYIGSYPKYYNKPTYPKYNGPIFHRSIIAGYKFINVFGLRLISRFFSATTGLLNFIKSEKTVVLVYSAHTPFILAALLTKLIRKNTKICLILPDLPEFMGNQGWLIELLKKFDIILFQSVIKKFDLYVLLTPGMIDRLGLPLNKSIVMEGIADPVEHHIKSKYIDSINYEKFSFLYTGTLAKRYGILDLVNAFLEIESDIAELWICGDGDCKKYIQDAANGDPRIKFLGQVTRDDSLALQRRATILINPRPPDEFTKFSFPSKVLEYMSSGRPLIMHHLDGVPCEYNPYYLAPDGTGKENLKSCMLQAMTLSKYDLEMLGKNAMEFVQENKNPLTQTSKILTLINQNLS